MKTLIILAVLVLAVVIAKRVLAGPGISYKDAEQRVASGEAVLIDVREPAEWAAGVAESAVLLSLSDLNGGRSKWNPFLDKHRDKELLVYCRSGNRSGIAAGILRKEGFRVLNVGSFSGWKNSGLPTRQP
jgi:rhodanese-related sulfurtransferase